MKLARWIVALVNCWSLQSVNDMHLETLSNGGGAQSIKLFLMGCRREIPATVSFTSDTGWENDRTWSNGRKSSLKDYFDEVIMPLSIKYDFPAKFIRAVDKNKQELPTLIEQVERAAADGSARGIHIPMFGSKGGRLRQSCTDKWKIRAINQEGRRMGAKTMCSAQGIHIGEASRRVKGIFLRMDGKWSIYQTTTMENQKQPDGKKIKVEQVIKWLTHYYPLVDLGLNRNACQREVIAEGIPYLLSSECDGCPHKDLTRWERTDPEILKHLAATEARLNGQYFFTDQRIPLLEAIEVMKAKRAKDPEKYKIEADFGCGNAICGV